MELETELQRIDAETDTRAAEKFCPRPYRLDAYDQFWERLARRMNEGSLDAYVAAPLVEVGMLLAAGLYRVERAISVAADQANENATQNKEQTHD